MYKNRRSTFTFSRLALAGFFALAGGIAQAQTFTLQNNQLQITGGSGTTFSSQTQTISSAGVIGNFIDVPSTNGVGIPSFNFTLVPDSVPNGDYTFRVAVTIDDDANDRRMEAKIETLTLTVNGSTVTGTIPVAANPNGLRVFGRDGGNTLQVSLNVANDQASGPITVSGGTVSFNASTLIDRIRSSTTTAFDTYILKEFDQPATYSYRIAVQQTSTTAVGNPTLNFGTTQPAFTALPKVGVDVVSNTAFILGGGSSFASQFTSAPSVTGKFNVVFVAASSGGGGGTSGGTTTADSVADAADAIVVPDTGTVSTEVVTQINDAVTSSNTLLTSTLSDLENGGSAQATTAALTALTSVNKALSKAGDARKLEGGNSVSTTESANAVSNIAGVLGALAKAGTALNADQKAAIDTVVASTVTSATNLITANTPRSEVLKLVEATSKLLQNSADATGEVKAALKTQLKSLATSAVSTILPTLPESIRGSTTDLQSIDAIRALMTGKPTAAAIGVTSSPSKASISKNNNLVNASIAAFDSSKASIEVDTEHLRDAVLADTQTLGTSNNGQLHAATENTLVLARNPSSVYIARYNESNFSATLGNVRLVSEIFTDGIYTLPNGELFYVKADEGIEFSAAPLSIAAFSNAVTAAGFSEAGNDFTLAKLNLENNERFSGVFAFDDIGSASTECSSVTFNAPTGSPLSTDYVFEMVCSGGAVQKITPYPDNVAFFDTVTNAGFDLSTNRNTGVISIEGVGDVRPSYFVTPPTLADTAYLNANKTAEGIAVRATDANSDGKVDYEILSTDGVQVLYGL